jgi:hypothetical protein
MSYISSSFYVICCLVNLFYLLEPVVFDTIKKIKISWNSLSTATVTNYLCLFCSVGDETVNAFVSRPPLSEYFSETVRHFQKQCINLDKLVTQLSRYTSPDLFPIVLGLKKYNNALQQRCFTEDINSSGCRHGL